MKIKKIKVVYCPYCGKGHNVIRDEDEGDINEIKCPYCKKEFNLKDFGL